MTPREMPPGFETAHEEWLLQGGKKFRDGHRFLPTATFYETRYWKLVRESVLISRNFVCCRCGGKANQVHHKNYNHKGEDHFYPENLVAICRGCHGLAEYARRAEALVSRIERRISLCEGFLEGRYAEQNPAHVYARLLEYQGQLAELQNRFTAQAPYDNSSKTKTEIDNYLKERRRECENYEDRAKIITSNWKGDENEKAKNCYRC